MNSFDHLVLIDGSGFIFRAFYALPPLVRPSDQAPTGAVYGFCKMLRGMKKTFSDMTHVAVILDKSRRNWRHEIYPDYKSNRKSTPEELRSQLPLMRDAVKAFNVAVAEQDGYEADDLIATYATRAAEAGASVSIISSDKDMHQLMSDSIAQWDPLKERLLTDEDVIAKFGVKPDRVLDVQSFMGDSTDGIPGVPGIGVKIASKLVKEYGSFDAVIDNIDRISPPGVRGKLKNYEHLAHTSRQLASLKRDVPTEIDMAAFACRPVDLTKLDEFYSLMEFESLTATA